MKRSKRVANSLAVATLLLIALLAVAEQAPKAQTGGATVGADAKASPRDSNSGMSNGRQDQFGHASGKQAAESVPATPTTDVNRADAKSMGSAHATEALTKKHIAGVKYGDRTANPSVGTPAAQPSEMTIKENGISSKPAPKPKP